MKWQPDHRLVAVNKAAKNGHEPSDPREQELCRLLKGEKVGDAVTRARDIHSHTYKREVMESFLLVGVAPEDILAVLKIPVEVTEAYNHLFFDTGAFEDELDRLEYAYSYSRNDYGAKLKRFSVDFGKNSLMIRMSRGESTISPLLVQNEIRATAYMIAQRAKTNPVDSAIAKEAREWAKLALKASSDVEEERTVSNIEELQLALDAKDETTNEEKSGIKSDDILGS